MIPRSGQFRRLWIGQASSQLGNRLQQLAVSWWVLQTTGSSAKMGLVLLAGTLPMVLGGPLFGVLADRMERRALMLAADGLSALAVAVMALLAWQGWLGIPLLLAIQLLLGTLNALLMPTSMAMVPQLVEPEELVSANALQEASTQGAGIAGPALGGLLVAWLGAPFAFAVNALSFFVSAGFLASMAPQPRPQAAAGSSVGRDLGDGFRLLGERPAVLALLLSFAAINVVFAALPVMLPLFAARIFACGAGGLGLMEGSLGVGLVAAALAMGRVGTVKRRVTVIAACMALQGLVLVLSGQWPSFYGFVAALFGLGSALSVINAIALATFQTIIPPEKLGRFMGLLMAVVMGTMPLSYAAFGVLGAHLPLGPLWQACGVVILLVGAGLPLWPAVRALDRSVAAACHAKV